MSRWATLLKLHLLDRARRAIGGTGRTIAAGAVLVVFYPSARHGDASAAAAGLENVEILPAPGGNIYVVGEAAGGDWSLEVDEIG